MISKLMVVILLSLGSAALYAAQPVQVTTLDISGNQRIEPETIRSLLVQAPGGGFTEESINQSIKRLYDSGYFSDVEIRLRGHVLMIKVSENPSINRIGFEGNNEIEEDLLRAEVAISPRQSLTQARIKQAVTKIQRLYRLKGYFAAEVIPMVVRLPQNRADIVFEIQEGPRTKVAKIFFIGNKNFSDGKLEETIQTKETRWYRFFSSDDNYDPDRIAYDRELLRLFYLEHGYADFKVLSAVAELTPDKKEFFITYTLDEGERYHIGKVNFSSKLPDFNAEALQSVITFSSGDWYNNKDVERSVDKIVDEMGKAGYAFIDVFPNIQRNPETKTLDITFELSEGPRVYIESISIIGNGRTDDDVIRRELLFYEGDAFNSDRMNRSERRVKNLGYFKEVKFKKTPGSYPDRVNIVVEIEEDRTGEVSVAGGFSTSDGPLVNLKYTERNFRGRGQDLVTGVTWARHRQEIDLSFTEPYFMGREIAAGFDLFSITQNKFFNEAFQQRIKGVTLRMGYELQEDLSQLISYTLREDTIGDIRSDSSRFILDQRGTHSTSEIAHRTQYDKRDSRINTMQGWLVGFSNALAGLGGDTRYLKTSIFGAYYYPFANDIVLELSGDISFIRGLGKKVRVSDRYSLGGDHMRGFAISGIGTVDRKTADPLGGLNKYVATAEVTFPLGLPNELGIKGASYVDVGSVWKTDDVAAEVYDSSAPRISVGVGIRWRSPLGPLKVDYAIPVKKQSFDRVQRFLFGISTRF